MARDLVAVLRNDELLKALSDAGGAGRSAELERRLSVLERENAQLKVSTESTQNKVADAIQANTPLVERALSTLSPAQRSAASRAARPVPSACRPWAWTTRSASH
ncbi:hypothetical protein [Methyloversatilis thermotolerans]|uniref:hypothetical protein n=1 Tax=Methyloversatilis thermotolerans TaxID=1346290 RepID=UPI00035EF265|nr:hypothetical protein [Methyloversatilis thermotolerans]